jgi:hypothetical protein
MRKFALPAGGHPGPDQWHVLHPVRNRDALLIGGGDLQE